MKRREFVKICASAVAGVSASPELLAKGDREMHPYNRVALVDSYSKESVPGFRAGSRARLIYSIIPTLPRPVF